MGDIRKKRCTARGQLVDPKQTQSGAPTDEKLPDGQYADHYVLCPEDRAKGYVEPFRDSYVHVGPPGPEHELRDLTEAEARRFADSNYVKFEPYPDSPGLRETGRFWTQAQLDKVDKGCGGVTFMPKACAETYAAKPEYYGSTFCCKCRAYFPVGAKGEFVWDARTMQRVGTRR